MKILGIALVVLGVIGLAYGGIVWTTREKVIDMGPLQVTQDKQQSIPIPPIAGGISLVAGLAILLSNRRKA